MAQQNRTEQATPRKRNEARKKGQVARSNDLTVGLVLLAGAGAFWLAGQVIGQRLMSLLHEGLLTCGLKELSVDAASTILGGMFTSVLLLMAPVLGAVGIVAIAVNLVQTGVMFSLHPITPDVSRLSPTNGWSKLFSMKSGVSGAMLIAKAIIALAIAGWIISTRLGEISRLGSVSLQITVSIGWSLILQCVLAIAAAYVLVGLADYIFQWWKHEEDLKMTRQEVIDEQKQENGDPEMKLRMRKLQRELGERKMLRDVPDATVILTNPTHYAVALRYIHGKDHAPVVIAKGADALAKRIIRIAKENGVPVLERKPLARALFAMTEVGSEIPLEFYQAIVPIISQVQNLRAAA